MKLKLSKSMYPRILIFCVISFVVLSWILLLRDIRAIKVFGLFSPVFGNLLQTFRNFLLHKGLNIIPTFLFVLVSLITFYYYFKSLKENISARKTIFFALVFQSIVFFSYPILSTDIFSYIMTSRVSVAHNSNIWKVPPDHFPADPFLRLSDWKTVPGIYGYADQFFYNATTLISVDNLFINLFLNKLLVFIFAILTLHIVKKILLDFFNDKDLLGIRLIFWNPLFLLEIIGAGHNDILMIFFMSLAYYFFLKKSYFLFGTIIALSVHTKIIPLFLLIFIVSDLLRAKKIKELFSLSIPLLIINSLFFYLMDLTPLEYLERLQYNTNINWQSVQSLAARFGVEAHGIFTLIFGVFVLVILLLQFIKKINPVTSYISVISIYLLFITSAYWNWYALWILTFLPYISNKRIISGGIALTFTSLLAYPIYWTSLRFDYQNIWWAVTILLFLFVIPIVGFILKKPDISHIRNQIN